MKDLFSRDSKSYARFRPAYPPELYDHILSYCKVKETAWDCATGNGQAAEALSDEFKNVHATDISATQLEAAVKKENIAYSRTGIKCPAEDSSVDLVTVAQALHWLPLEDFYKEVKRVSRPEGILAAWTYGLLQVNERIDKIILDFYENRLEGCWDDQRKHVDNGYKDLPFPFRLIPSPLFQISVTWNVNQLTGFLDTWSAIPVFKARHGYDPIPVLHAKLLMAWGEEEHLQVRFPLQLKMGFVN